MARSSSPLLTCVLAVAALLLVGGFVASVSVPADDAHGITADQHCPSASDAAHEEEAKPPPSAVDYILTVKPIDTCATILAACTVRCPGITYAALAAQNGGKPCCYAGCVIKTPPVAAGTVLNYTC